MFDWEKENSAQEQKLLEGSNPDEDRLPARITVRIIKSKEDDNQTNKRSFRGVIQKGI
jgi:hypothetical protein